MKTFNTDFNVRVQAVSKKEEMSMPSMKRLDITLLQLDLDNFRTVHQKNETHAINTMISISPGWFWALLESLLEDGYHATENIILLEADGKYVVKEGNRRIGALKIILGKVKGIDIPDSISLKIKNITEDWKIENSQVPCSIYKSTEAQSVEKIISLIHAKGEKAGRDHWTTVARARYSRDYQNQPEQGLDLLEKYLKQGNNLSEAQAERWSGDYPLTVLDEALQKCFTQMGFSTITEMIASYPKKQKGIIDKMVFDIGMQSIGFKEIRDKTAFFGNRYGLNITFAPPKINSAQPVTTFSPATTQTTSMQSSAINAPISKLQAQPSNEPKAVYRQLKKFHPLGNNREKLVTLLNELKKLKIDIHPHAFCFLLRSMFELSAKAYCADFKSAGGPSTNKADGNEKTLAVLLRDITDHLTKNKSDKEKNKVLHGATAELAKPNGLLSVTSLNQLVHNPSFSISVNDICILFGNIFPLLEDMNK